MEEPMNVASNNELIEKKPLIKRSIAEEEAPLDWFLHFEDGDNCNDF